MNTRILTVAILPALLSAACVTTTRTTRTWGEVGQSWARYGRVTTIRETVTTTQGDPAAGAAVGAVIGGLLGLAMSGGHHHGRHHHADAGGAVIGAIGGAAVGAATSQSGEERTYEVTVHYDDGGVETYTYGGWSPFQVGEAVVLGPQGLSRA